MATTAPSNLPGYSKYIEEGGTQEALHMSIVTEFWLSIVNTFGALYEVLHNNNV